MALSNLLILACIFVYSLILCESMPIAFPQLVVVQPASYALIRLRGYDINVPKVSEGAIEIALSKFIDLIQIYLVSFSATIHD